jgi:hypothetical protein
MAETEAPRQAVSLASPVESAKQDVSVQAGEANESAFGIWPLDGEQWQTLAARLGGETSRLVANRAENPSRRDWWLYTPAPDAPDARRLAELLRAALPAGTRLSVVADNTIPGGHARLVR